MDVEIERKFLVKEGMLGDIGINGVKTIKQGYLSNSKEKSVRIRIDDNRGCITIKGVTTGISKSEFEYEIPINDANEILEKLTDGGQIEKKRYISTFGGEIWEIDVFQGKNQGLVLAEIELESEDEKITIPDGCGQEVSTDPKYINTQLVKKPYTEW